ncbi:fatty acyl CoA synthetase [Lysobacter sp. TY2-98]|uniref:LolA-related protein n=1 Tax=Lysobacter sp. TY2-98 TaxID=2290922 RepID=UPI000E201428|nr:LolA-related protein [Lysobacter sp. TY2-98]AXK73057.1 fatty acyl CoA synthetase [Lysobacter sp. TY2-98]
MPRRSLLPLLLLTLAMPSVHAASPEIETGWILSKLARPAPMRTQFVELHGSRLLKAPLRIEGEYARPNDDTLVREVRLPYAETSTIRAGSVTIKRGTSSHTYSLDRAPQLAGLQSSFGALLSGDRTQLERAFRIDSSGSREQWTLQLTPKDKRTATYVRTIALYGRGAELRCIETTPAKGDLQRTLLAGAAQSASGVADAASLTTLCHGAATR